MTSVTFTRPLVVHGVRVVEREDGLFMAMLRQRGNASSFRAIARLATAETRALAAKGSWKNLRAIGRDERPQEVRARLHGPQGGRVCLQVSWRRLGRPNVQVWWHLSYHILIMLNKAGDHTRKDNSDLRTRRMITFLW